MTINITYLQLASKLSEDSYNYAYVYVALITEHVLLLSTTRQHLQTILKY